MRVEILPVGFSGDLDLQIQPELPISYKGSRFFYRAIMTCSDDPRLDERLDSVLQTAGITWWNWDIHSGKMQFGPDLMGLLGYAAEELPSTYETWQELIHPEDRPAIATLLDQMRQGEVERSTAEIRQRAKGNGWRWMRWHGQIAARDARGLATRVVSCQVDITEQKQVEEALLQQAEHYRTLIQNQGEGLGIVDENEVFTFANPAAEKVFGVAKGTLVGRNLRDLVTSDQFALILSQTTIRREGQQSSYELEICRPDGSVCTILLTATPRYDATGAYRGAFGVFRDITEKKRAELDLRESEERYRLLVELLPHGIGILDRTGVLYANRAALSILGYEHPEDFIGQDPFSFLVERERERVGMLMTDLVSGKVSGPLKYSTSALHRAGHEVPVEAYVNLIPFRGARAVQLFMIDQTERQRTESERAHLEEQLRASQKLEWLGRLAGGIAHDFNNVLSPIVGYSELALLDLFPEDPLRKDLLQIREAAEQAKNLVQQLLAFGRKQMLQVRLLNLNQIITESRTMLRRLIREDVHIDFQLDPSLGSIRADASQFQQILMNLTLNAQDAMPRGGKMTIRTSNATLNDAYCAADPELQPGAYVMLEVTDEGRGMEAAILSHIFEPFFSTKKPGQGVGLGLATVHGIVKQHRGHISVSSQIGRGTTFQMYLPLMHEGAEALTSFRLEPTDVRLDGTILLVEDDNMVRLEARKILERYGSSVIEARDGYEALMLAKYHKGPIDLLLTDVIMPGLNGKDLYRHISQIRPDTKVLYMSGYAADVIADHGVLDESIPYLQKPFTIHQLIEKVLCTLGH